MRSERILRHVVLFQFQPETTPAEIGEIEDAFRRLPEQIPAIHGFEWGTDVSVEGLTHGFTHCFLVSFRSEKDRDTYLPHPAHKAFSALLRPHRAQVLVLDFWSQD